jgi:tetraacyldisaccharide 4'-kinase
MREPGFWWRQQSVAGMLLAPVGAAYGAVAARLMATTGDRAAVPVICVGNLTLGGSGKTPTAIAIARSLAAAGEKPFMLTRGYGGTQSGPLHVDLKRHRARDVGDEPLLLARVAPTIVSSDRVLGARVAHASGATVVVMDDGLQNPSLHKNLALAVIDGRRGVGNGLVFPAGPLRAPLARQLGHIHAVLVIDESPAASPLITAAQERKLPVFRGKLAPDPASIEALRGRKILAFAGIGDPEKFFATLTIAGIEAPVRRGFADHHRYSVSEAQSLIADAERDGLTLLTTEKDLARLNGEAGLAVLAAKTQALPVTLRLDDEAAFFQSMQERMRS